MVSRASVTASWTPLSRCLPGGGALNYSGVNAVKLLKIFVFSESKVHSVRRKNLGHILKLCPVNREIVRLTTLRCFEETLLATGEH